MFDESGNALRPWAQAGCACYAFDCINTGRIEYFAGGGFIEYRYADFTNIRYVLDVIALRPSFVMGWPDCTHLTVAGTRHWSGKRALDPEFQVKAVKLARTVEFVGIMTGAPWFAENPVGRLTTFWRDPDYYFDPYEYGGYLPVNDVHPRWPKYIAPRDAYTKKTGLWVGNGFRMPVKLPVEPEIIVNRSGQRGSRQFIMLGGKSAKTKQIRSETARGFALANCLANYPVRWE